MSRGVLDAVALEALYTNVSALAHEQLARGLASLESLPERKAALDALLALSEEHPFDGPLLVAALRAYREADPTDVDARAALVRQLHGAGQLDEAAELLREAVRATDDTPTRLAALAELADICDIGLRDDEAAA